MSIISNISVGDISYFFVDQPPTHFAVKGCISIFDNFLYINNDGANTWIKILSPDHGSLNLSEYSTEVDFDAQTIGSWYPWNSVATYTLGNSVNFSRQTDVAFGDNLRYDGISTIRVLVRQTSTNRGGTGKWMTWLIGPAKNFTIPDKYNEFFVQDNSATQNVASLRVLELSTGDSVIASISPVDRENGGPGTQRTYLSKHSSLELIKIDEALSIPLFTENWESADFITEGWTTVNGSDYFELVWSGSSGDGDVTIDGTPLPTSFNIDINNTALGFTKQSFPAGITAVYQGANVVHVFGATTVTYAQNTANLQVAITEFTAETNQWVVGSAENNGGTYSAYVSDDGGTSAGYTITAASISHFYKDFTFSSGSSYVLTFDWKCQGENTAGNAVQYDYGAVVITDTTVTPVAGTEVSTVEATGTGNGRLAQDFAANDGKFNLGYGTNPGTTWNTESINISAYSGLTKRLVFTWVNDVSAGTNPPFSLDNIKIIETVW